MKKMAGAGLGSCASFTGTGTFPPHLYHSNRSQRYLFFAVFDLILMLFVHVFRQDPAKRSCIRARPRFGEETPQDEVRLDRRRQMSAKPSRYSRTDVHRLSRWGDCDTDHVLGRGPRSHAGRYASISCLNRRKASIHRIGRVGSAIDLVRRCRSTRSAATEAKWGQRRRGFG